jgi:hypothetical protein
MQAIPDKKYPGGRMKKGKSLYRNPYIIAVLYIIAILFLYTVYRDLIAIAVGGIFITIFGLMYGVQEHDRDLIFYSGLFLSASIVAIIIAGTFVSLIA